MTSRLALQISVAVILTSAMLPAYAEVTSLGTDRSFYSVDMTIFFTGTVDLSDSQKLVNLMIQDPTGKIVLMTGNPAGPNGRFQITVNTNDEKQFSLKGTYSATAFVNSATTGKTVFFDFSPDGSPVVHTVNGNLSAQATQQTNGSNLVDLSSEKRYSTLLFENVGILDHANFTEKGNQPYALSRGSSTPIPDTIIGYPLMIAAGAILVGFILYRRRKKQLGKEEITTSNKMDLADEDYAMAILKNRLAKGEITLAEFKATKDVLGEP